MKKIYRLLSAMLIMAMVLGGCGKTNTPDSETDTQQTESQSETENVATSEVEKESTEAVSETTTEVSTETDSETTTQEETETQAESEAPSEEPEAPTYTYTDLDKTMYAKSSVNVRDLPSTDGNKLGGLSKAQEVHVTGQCNETNWYRIEYNGGIGYVSNNYLQDTEPEQQVEIDTTQNSSNTYMMGGREFQYGVIYVNKCGNNLYDIENPTASEGKCPYPLYTMIDNGDGTYTAYIPSNHGGILDNQYFDFDYQKSDVFLNDVVAQGYIFQFAGGDSWHSCVGGYDEGCVHKIHIYKPE